MANRTVHLRRILLHHIHLAANITRRLRRYLRRISSLNANFLIKPYFYLHFSRFLRCVHRCFCFFSSFSLFFSVSVKTQILVKYFFADSLHNYFSLLQQKIVSEIRTILIFHYFTDKSAAKCADQTALLYGISRVSATDSFPKAIFRAPIVELFIKFSEYSSNPGTSNNIGSMSFAVPMTSTLFSAPKSGGFSKTARLTFLFLSSPMNFSPPSVKIQNWPS